MVEENSGKVFAFKLDHDFGFGFAEAYDFSDDHPFSGRLIFVYNLIVDNLEQNVSLAKIVSSGIALGPITLWRYPNSRGKGAWKFLGKMNRYIIDAYPSAKDLRANPFLHNNWSEFDKWYISSNDHDPLQYVPYETVRRMETRILNSKEGVVEKFTMKHIIDSGLKISDYYDLTDLGTRNMYVQLVNTYFPEEKVKELVKDMVILTRLGA